MKKNIRTLIIAAGLTCTLVLNGQALVYTVTNNNDSGDGSLRQRISLADGSPEGDAIYFQNVGTITILSTLSISGDDLLLGDMDTANQVVIDTAGGAFTAMIVNGNNVRIRNIALINSVNGSGTGLRINGDDAHVYGCRIGTDWSDSTGDGFNMGISLNGSDRTLIGFRIGYSGTCNTICDNVLGIYSYNCFGLVIEGNNIGASSDGNTAIQNTDGILLGAGTVQARIGGTYWPASRNIIIGQRDGIEIQGGAADTFGNTVICAWMNRLQDHSSPPYNFVRDIVIRDGAYGNYIGLPNAAWCSNYIYGAYVAISGTSTDYNGIYGNTLVAFGSNVAIDLVHPGSNNGKIAPVITQAGIGAVQGTGQNGDYIEVFVSSRAAGEQGGGVRYLGSTTVSGGVWSVGTSGLLSGGEVVTAIATDTANNSSEYAVNVFVPIPTATPSATPTHTRSFTTTFTCTATPSTTASHTLTSTQTSTITPTATISATFTITPTITPTATPSPTQTISQTATAGSALSGVDLGGQPALAFPNPAKDKMCFVLHLEQPARVEIQIYNLLGERVALLKENFPSGRGLSLDWNCRDMAPGVYIARVLLNGEKSGVLKLGIVK